jgi:hypothetical protein
MQNGKPSYSPAMYPQGVICAGIVAGISTTTRSSVPMGTTGFVSDAEARRCDGHVLLLGT